MASEAQSRNLAANSPNGDGTQPFSADSTALGNTQTLADGRSLSSVFQSRYSEGNNVSTSDDRENDNDGTRGIRGYSANRQFNAARFDYYAYYEFGGTDASGGGTGSTTAVTYPASANPDVYPATVNLFYFNNVEHDYLYSIGFTEPFWNFQFDNFGKGGAGNDGIVAEVQDGSGTDNANMSTPAEGSSPRMQMYLFTDGGLSALAVSEGARLADKVTLRGLQLAVCNPTFVDMRDSMLAADREISSGENQAIMWRAFAGHGVGTNAASTGKTNGIGQQGGPAAIVEDFSVPAGVSDCETLGPLPAPTFTLSNTIANTVTVTITPVSGAANYVIARSTDANGPFKTVATVSGTTYNDDDNGAGLVLGQTYYYEVHAARSQYCVGLGAIKNITVTVGTALSPAPVFAGFGQVSDPKSGLTLNLSWSPATSANSPGGVQVLPTTFTDGTVTISRPTAATVTISGRVILPQNIGLTNALVTLTDSRGNAQTQRSGKRGSFRFGEVAAGETYVISVSSRRYRFAPQVVNPTQNISDLNFNPVE